MDAAVSSLDQRAVQSVQRHDRFLSILFADGRQVDAAKEPGCFRDLNLDQIVRAVTAPKLEYNLAPFFYSILGDLDAIKYRHEVFRDLDNPDIAEALQAFASSMREVREHLAQAKKLYYRLQKEGWFLDAGWLYSEAVAHLVKKLGDVELKSPGLLSFRAYLSDYITAPTFAALVTDTAGVRSDLAAIRYSILIRSSSIQVRDYASEPDYTASVTKSFEKFQQGQVGNYAKAFGFSAEMNHVEAGILDYVAKLHPDAFSALDAYCARHARFIDDTIARFDREIQFYIGWSAYRGKFEGAGLSFCYPVVADEDKQIASSDGFDLALADKLISDKSSVVTNEFSLKDPERILVISGPNQGGKTTFARMFGQLNYLAALGCPIPGRRARTYLFDETFTHFEREEDISTLRGKLEDDLFRIHEILAGATPRSIIVMNEIFTSTTLSDAIALGKKVMERIIDLDLLCACVTFIDELAFLGPKVVSMASTVVPDNPAQRTFKIVRKPADGKAYAVFIAERYGLTFDRIGERLAS
jgi:hypothetical protein